MLMSKGVTQKVFGLLTADISMITISKNKYMVADMIYIVPLETLSYRLFWVSQPFSLARLPVILEKI